MKKFRISVVIPVYNEENFLEGVVRKIIRCGTDKIIIVDDGSTDGSSQIIDRLLKSNPKIKCLRIEVNSGGCGFPRELGTLVASSEYVAFCDSDITNIDQVDYGEILEAARRSPRLSLQILLQPHRQFPCCLISCTFQSQITS